MANERNLRVPTSKEAREIGRKGGKRSGEVRKKRKALKEELLLLLSEGDTQKNVSVALIAKALDGDIKAFEVIRDTIGEKPTNKEGLTVGNLVDGVIRVELIDDLDKSPRV